MACTDYLNFGVCIIARVSPAEQHTFSAMTAWHTSANVPPLTLSDLNSCIFTTYKQVDQWCKRSAEKGGNNPG